MDMNGTGYEVDLAAVFNAKYWQLACDCGYGKDWWMPTLLNFKQLQHVKTGYPFFQTFL